jgi:hypothetical protein
MAELVATSATDNLSNIFINQIFMCELVAGEDLIFYHS